MMRWECEVTELSEGVVGTVYDEQGKLMLDHIEPERAHIIAAAPAMLEALKAVRSTLVRLAWDENSFMVEGIDKAIAEAEGKVSMGQRTKIQKQADERDLEIFNLATRIERFADDLPWTRSR